MSNVSSSLQFLVDHNIITKDEAEEASKYANGKTPIRILRECNKITEEEALLATQCRDTKSVHKATRKLAKIKQKRIESHISEINELILSLNT